MVVVVVVLCDGGDGSAGDGAARSVLFCTVPVVTGLLLLSFKECSEGSGVNGGIMALCGVCNRGNCH